MFFLAFCNHCKKNFIKLQILPPHHTSWCLTGTIRELILHVGTVRWCQLKPLKQTPSVRHFSNLNTELAHYAIHFQSFSYFKRYINVFLGWLTIKKHQQQKFTQFLPWMIFDFNFWHVMANFCMQKCLLDFPFYFFVRNLGEATLTSFIDEIFEFFFWEKSSFPWL